MRTGNPFKLALCLALAIPFALAACGGGGGGTPNTQAQNPTPTPTPAPTPPETPPTPAPGSTGTGTPFTPFAVTFPISEGTVWGGGCCVLKFDTDTRQARSTRDNTKLPSIVGGFPTSIQFPRGLHISSNDLSHLPAEVKSWKDFTSHTGSLPSGTTGIQSLLIRYGDFDGLEDTPEDFSRLGIEGITIYKDTLRDSPIDANPIDFESRPYYNRYNAIAYRAILEHSQLLFMNYFQDGGMRHTQGISGSHSAFTMGTVPMRGRDASIEAAILSGTWEGIAIGTERIHAEKDGNFGPNDRGDFSPYTIEDMDQHIVTGKVRLNARLSPEAGSSYDAYLDIQFSDWETGEGNPREYADGPTIQGVRVYGGYSRFEYGSSQVAWTLPGSLTLDRASISNGLFYGPKSEEAGAQFDFDFAQPDPDSQEVRGISGGFIARKQE